MKWEKMLLTELQKGKKRNENKSECRNADATAQDELIYYTTSIIITLEES